MRDKISHTIAMELSNIDDRMQNMNDGMCSLNYRIERLENAKERCIDTLRNIWRLFWFVFGALLVVAGVFSMLDGFFYGLSVLAWIGALTIAIVGYALVFVTMLK